MTPYYPSSMLNVICKRNIYIYIVFLGIILHHDGYRYNKKNRGPYSQEWRCSSRELHGCPGKLYTNLHHASPQVKVQHQPNCIQDHSRWQREALKQDMQKDAAKGLSKPYALYAHGMTTLSAEDKAMFTDKSSTCRNLRRIRAVNYPKDPETLDGLKFEGQWAMFDDEEHFLLHDNGAGSPNRVIVFATRTMLTALETRCDMYAGDGTFKICPTLFEQLYVVLGRVDGRYWLPLTFALMENRNKASYEVLFTAVHEAIPNWRPALWYQDFEQAPRIVLEALFAMITIICCWFHLTKNTFKNVGELGMIQRYNTDEEFRLHCGKLDALALLPLGDVVDGMELLKQNQPEGAEPITNYFNKNYVSGVTGIRGNLQAVRPRNTPPLFPPETWNVHEATMNNHPRTNNMSEGTNNKLMNLVNIVNPSPWKLYAAIRAEAHVTHQALEKINRGTYKKRPTPRPYVRIQTALQTLIGQYLDDGDKDHFLRGAAMNIRHGNPVLDE